MPAPVLIGLPLLAVFLSKLFDKFIDVVFSKAAKKFAIITIVVAGIYAALMTLLGLIGIYATPLLSALPVEITSLVGAALPSNTDSCLAAIAATELACLAYSLTIKALEVQTKIVS